MQRSLRRPPRSPWRFARVRRRMLTCSRPTPPIDSPLPGVSNRVRSLPQLPRILERCSRRFALREVSRSQTGERLMPSRGSVKAPQGRGRRRSWRRWTRQPARRETWRHHARGHRCAQRVGKPAGTLTPRAGPVEASAVDPLPPPAAHPEPCVVAATAAATPTPSHGVRWTRMDNGTRLTCANATSYTPPDDARTLS